MRKETRVKFIYVIESEEDIKLFRFLLGYCLHRATKHKTPVSGLTTVIKKLIEQFD